jgi:LL-diaminopimelate aminotransferase
MSMHTSAERLQRVQPQFFAGLNEKIDALKSQGHDVIRMDIGSPDLPPAKHIIAALAEAAGRGNSHGYQAHRATPALRWAWADMYRRLFGVVLDPDRQVVPLLGSKEGIFHLLSALVGPGDVVLVPDPGYLTYTQGTLLAGGEPYFLPLLASNHFLPDLESVPPDVRRRAKVLWLNYPNNPTAATASLDFFGSAVEYARRYKLLVCHDAAYNQVTFDGYAAPSILQVPGAEEVAVEFNTLSKSHNMAGWRVGAALGQIEALRALFTLKTHADSGHFLPILEAATAALNGDQGWLVDRNRIYQQRRDVAMGWLKEIGLAAENPLASLYIWLQTPSGWGCEALAGTLLEKAHVSLTPGTVFGRHGEGYLRLSLTASEERIAAGLQRILESGIVQKV